MSPTLWEEFSLDSEQPVIFRLVNAQENYSGDSGVQGKWRIVEEIDASACGEGVNIVSYSLQFLESDNTLSIISSVGTFTADMQDLSLQRSGSYPDDDGTVSTVVNLMFGDSLNNLIGTSQWSWTNGSNNCDGVSAFTGELLHN